MKEFVVYTALRLLLFLASAGIVFGVWALVAGSVPIFWVVIIAFLISGIGSYFVLNPQREKFARRVEERAAVATKAFEERKAREDVD